MISEKLLATVRKIIVLSALCISFMVAVKALSFMIGNISLGYPAEPRENAVIFTTDLLVHGENPYSLKHHPTYINMYGIGYSWVVYPFAKYFGAGYATHRAISCFVIILSCVFLFWGIKCSGVLWDLAAVAAFMQFFFLVYSLHAISRPDSLGLALFLASVVIPYKFRFSKSSLFTCCALSILGFLTKPYFIFGVLCVAAYMFLFISKIRSIKFVFVFAAAMAVVVIAINIVYETYFMSTFFIYLYVVTNSIKHLHEVGLEFIKRNGFLIILMLWLSLLMLIKERKTIWLTLQNPWNNLKDLRAPLLSFQADLSTFMLICGVLFIILKLGRHTGNGTMYYYQFVTPFLFWSAFKLYDVNFKRSFISAVLILIYCISLYRLPAPTRPSDFTTDWNALDAVIKPYKEIFHSYALAGLIKKQGRVVYDTGQTEYAVSSKSKFPKVSRQYQELAKKHRENILKRVINRSFDLIILQKELQSDFIPKSVLEDNYILIRTMPMNMTYNRWNADLYIPKKTNGIEG